MRCPGALWYEKGMKALVCPTSCSRRHLAIYITCATLSVSIRQSFQNDTRCSGTSPVRANMNLYRGVTLMSLVLLLSGCSTPGPTKQSVPPQRVNADEVSMKKVDPSLLVEINKLPAEQQADGWIDVIIRTSGQIGPSERAEIERMGGRISSVLGDVVVARIPAGRIIDIARLDFIIYMEKAKKLYPK